MFLALFAGHMVSWRASVEKVLRVTADAQARGDLTLEAHIILGSIIHPGLITDEPDEAEREVEEVFSRWQQDDFDLMHFYCHIMRLTIRSYRGEYADALAMVRDVEPKMRRSGALNSGANVTQWATVVAAVTAGSVLQGIATRADIRRAERLVRADEHSVGWRGTVVCWAGSALAAALGDLPRAHTLIERSIEAARGQGMRNMAIGLGIHRHRLNGELASPACQDLIEQSKVSGFVAPLRFLDAYAPLRDG